MRLSELLKKIEYTGSFNDFDIDHITNDSRQASKSSIFVCIKGFATDGHRFIPSAYDKGCRVFVCEYIPKECPDDCVLIKVENSRHALALLSSALYCDPSNSLITIGITGTKGKTTTALMIKQLLDTSGIPTGYIGSNGIIFGSQRFTTANTTPESHILQSYLAKMVTSGVKAVVMEVSSQAIKLDRICGIHFDITLFSNLSPDHIGPGEHSDFDDYKNTKKKLFELENVKAVIANADDPYTDEMLDKCKSKKIYYSTKQSADYYAAQIELHRTDEMLGMKFICKNNNASFPCSLSVPGEFNVHNALATIAVAKELGIDNGTISNALSAMRIDGRFETIVAPNGACFVIDYAHNGLSLRSALTALRKYEPSRLICLFGSVGCRTQVRRAQMGKAAYEYADFSILTSDNPDTENPYAIIDDIASQYPDPTSYIAIPDRKKAIKHALDISESGDIILLAGKGHERYQLINGRNEYFCEREIILEHIRTSKFSKL